MNSESKIGVCSRSFSKHPILREELLLKYPHVKFNDLGVSLSGQELIDFLQGCDKAVIALEEIDEKILKALPTLKVIGKYGVGLDKLDFLALDKMNVKLGWTPGVNANAVAELTLCMALAIVRKVFQSYDIVKKGEWAQVKGLELSSLTYGILGLGHVGKALAKLLKPFGMRIICCDIVDYSGHCKESGLEQVSFETLMKESDVLSIHIPKNKNTVNIISKKEIQKMKIGSFIINTARGGLIDESSLLEALNSGHILAAGLDVLESEPPVNQELINHNNLFITSHIAGSSEEAILAMGKAAIIGLDQYREAREYELYK